MSGYLEEYGAGEETRENRVRNVILIVLAVLIAGGFAFYLFRPFHQISVAKSFLSRVRAQDYPGAYAAWGCTGTHPCKDYTYQKFLEDWGPKSPASASPNLRIADAESCGAGEIVTVNVGSGDRQKLFVEKGSDSLSFSPVQVCPGKSPWAILLHRTLGRTRSVFF